MNFGRLRVLNDDFVTPGQGFGTHPHENMEIVSIPLSGALAHKDSAGHEEVIRANDVQVMSAGAGIRHSEYNHSQDETVNFLQIWILPDRNGHEPRYDQKTLIVYLLMTEGGIEVAGEKLNKRDGIGLWELEKINIGANAASRVLTIEVPMK